MTTDIVKADALGPATLPQMIDYAEKLSNAGLLPAQYRKQPANVLFAMEYGRTLGITPVAAITGIHVIEGKPSASAGLIGALVRQAGHKLRVSGNDQRAVATIVRADDPEFEFRSEWTVDRAVRAGLCQLKDGRPFARDSKGKAKPWEAYTAAMLKARAITEVARDACEDVLFGLHYTPEELGAVVDQDGLPVDAPVQPLRSVDAQVVEPAAPGRDYIAEARAAATAEEVRDIYLAAGADPTAPPELAAQLTAIGKEKAALKPDTTDEQEPVDAELVEPDEATDHKAAEAELRTAAIAAGITDVDAEFEQSYGLPIDHASAAKLREMASLLSAA